MPSELADETARLVPLEESHVPALYEAGRDPRIWAYMPAKMESLEDMTALVRTLLAEKERGISFPFVIRDARTDRIVGATSYLDMAPPHRGLEIGWTWHAPETWRTGINTACKYLLLRCGFESLDLLRVQFKTDSRNIRSQQAIERIGGVREGVLRRHRVLPDGHIRDSVYYSIIAEEWPAVKERFETVLLRRPDVLQQP